MRLKLNAIFLVLIVLASFSAKAGNFNKELSELLNIARTGFQAIQGDLLETHAHGDKVYKCLRPLSHFDGIFVVLHDKAKLIYMANSTSTEAFKDISDLILSPPAGYEIHDSEKDTAVHLKKSETRKIVFLSSDRDLIIHITFLGNALIILGISTPPY